MRRIAQLSDLPTIALTHVSTARSGVPWRPGFGVVVIGVFVFVAFQAAVLLVLISAALAWSHFGDAGALALPPAARTITGVLAGVAIRCRSSVDGCGWRLAGVS